MILYYLKRGDFHNLNTYDWFLAKLFEIIALTPESRIDIQVYS